MGSVIHLHDTPRPSHRPDRNAILPGTPFLLPAPAPSQWQGSAVPGHGSSTPGGSEPLSMVSCVLDKSLRLPGSLRVSCRTCYRAGQSVCESDGLLPRHQAGDEAINLGIGTW